MNNNREFAKNIGWMGISKFASQILSWVGTIYVARVLAPTDYGLIGMCSLFMGVITLVGDFGLNASIIQKKTNRAT